MVTKVEQNKVFKTVRHLETTFYIKLKLFLFSQSAELFLETAGQSAPNLNETSFLSQLSRAAHSSRAATITHKPNQHRLLTILESLDFSEEVLRQPQYEVT